MQSFCLSLTPAGVPVLTPTPLPNRLLERTVTDGVWFKKLGPLIKEREWNIATAFGLDGDNRETLAVVGYTLEPEHGRVCLELVSGPADLLTDVLIRHVVATTRATEVAAAWLNDLGRVRVNAALGIKAPSTGRDFCTIHYRAVGPVWQPVPRSWL